MSFDFLRSSNDLGLEVSESVTLDTPKTLLADAKNLTRKISATPEVFEGDLTSRGQIRILGMR